MKRQAKISFDVPDTVTRAELRAFIVAALETWGGQRHPDDHLFYSLGNVKVTFAAKVLGQRGGKARARSLTPERRQEIAKKGAAKRWEK